MSRVFEQFPTTSFCPVCMTKDNRECVLVPINGTEDDGIVEVLPVHLDCTIAVAAGCAHSNLRATYRKAKPPKFKCVDCGKRLLSNKQILAGMKLGDHDHSN